MKQIKLLVLLALVLASPVLYGYYRPNIQYAPSDGMVEHVVLNPARSRQGGSLGTGWPSVVTYEPGADLPKITSIDFSPSTSNTMHFMWHPLHHATRAGDLFIDFHNSMTTANAGKVRFRVKMWKATINTNLASLGAATVTTDWTYDPPDTTRTNYPNFFVGPGYSGSVYGGQVGVVSMTSLGLSSIQDEVHVAISREVGHSDDTHTGSLSLYRVEFHYPVKPLVLAVGD